MSIERKYKTPLIKNFRENGETMVVFPSAMEDIGLNLNERRNRVALTHYALLEIPSTQPTGNPDSDQLNGNRIDFNRIQGVKTALSDNEMTPNQLLSVSLRNYVMNFETTLRNAPEYNANILDSVSERVFFKWLKELGAIRFKYDEDTDTWLEPTFDNYRRVVHCIGEINAYSNNRNEFGMFNETYISCPSSYGSNPMRFISKFDTNYKAGYQYGASSRTIEGQTNVEGSNINLEALGDFQSISKGDDSYMVVGSDDKTISADFFEQNQVSWWQMEKKDYGADMEWSVSDVPVYITDDKISRERLVASGSFLDDTIQYPAHGGEKKKFKRSRLDGISLVKDLESLKRIHKDETMTYDKLAMTGSIDTEVSATADRSFDFNTILIYYTIYNSDGTEALATNLYGVVFIDGAKSVVGSNAPLPIDQVTLKIPTIKKRMSSVNSFGNSYSFKINVKTLDSVDDTATTIIDQTTSSHLAMDEMRDVFFALNTAVQTMMENNKALVAINERYRKIEKDYESILESHEKLREDIKVLRAMKLSKVQQEMVDSIISRLGGDVPSMVEDVKLLTTKMSKVETENERLSSVVDRDVPNLAKRLANVESKIK
jgi:hypothetical protein